jgi:hypothetical protein
MKPTRPVGSAASAAKTTNTLVLNGVERAFPAMVVDNFNWLRLRDLAMLLSGTSKQFAVGYDAATNTVVITTGQPYGESGAQIPDLLPAGAFTAIASPQKIMVDGKLIEIAAYNFDGFNYFRLRDIAILLDFSVDFSAADGKVTLDLAKKYAG